MVGSEEYQVVGPTKTEEFEPEYTGCHPHSTKLYAPSSRFCSIPIDSLSYCMNAAGDDVQILIEGSSEGGEDHDHADSHDEHSSAEGDADSAGGVHCHEHAGVP